MDVIDALLRQGPLIAVGTVIYMVGILLGLAFTLMYAFTAPWWRSAIGRMFIVIGSAVVMAGVTVLLSLLLGADYPGREIVRMAGFGFFSAAMGFLFFTYLHERRKPPGSSRLPIRKDKQMKNALLALLTSIVRTITPVVVGGVVSWFTSKGIEVDPDLQATLTLVIAFAATAIYYTLIRLLETYVTPKLGWLLGVAKAPAAYTAESPAKATERELTAAATEAIQR
jgi:hypothetical protein